LEGDVAFGLDIARQSGWEARDNQDRDRCRSVMIIAAKIVVRKRTDLENFYIFWKRRLTGQLTYLPRTAMLHFE
jgi:hypothetical protein